MQYLCRDIKLEIASSKDYILQYVYCTNGSITLHVRNTIYETLFLHLSHNSRNKHIYVLHADAINLKYRQRHLYN